MHAAGNGRPASVGKTPFAGWRNKWPNATSIIELLYEQRRAAEEWNKAFYEQYKSVEWEFDAKGKLLVKLIEK
jgi:hypothetical protein